LKLKAIPPTATHVIVAWSVRLYVCRLSHTKAVGRNEMPLGRDNRMVPSNFVLDRSPSPPRGDLGGSEPPVRSDAAYYQIALAIVFAEHMV